MTPNSLFWPPEGILLATKENFGPCMESECCLTVHGRDGSLDMGYMVHNAQNKCCDLVISAVFTSAVMFQCSVCLFYLIFHVCHGPGRVEPVSRSKSRLQAPGDL